MPPTSRAHSPDISIGTRERVPSRRETRDLIKLAFESALPKQRISNGEIADDIGAAENTVDGWRREGVMSAEFLMIMQVRYPGFEAELRRVFNLRRELSPDFAREFAALIQRVL